MAARWWARGAPGRPADRQPRQHRRPRAPPEEVEGSHSALRQAVEGGACLHQGHGVARHPPHLRQPLHHLPARGRGQLRRVLPHEDPGPELAQHQPRRLHHPQVLGRPRAPGVGPLGGRVVAAEAAAGADGRDELQALPLLHGVGGEGGGGGGKVEAGHLGPVAPKMGVVGPELLVAEVGEGRRAGGGRRAQWHAADLRDQVDVGHDRPRWGSHGDWG